MPQQETFFNPYRWVHVDQAATHTPPPYHHRFEGQAGQLKCRLTALTPMIVAGSQAGTLSQFVSHQNKQPFIPGTSLKGAIRSLAEVVTGSAVAHGKGVDSKHRPDQATQGSQTNWKLDLVAQSFGMLRGKESYTGHIQFSDAALTDSPLPQIKWPKYDVVVGAPKPAHWAFYPSDTGRKFYHHRPGATTLTQRPPNIHQFRTVQPAPAKTSFEFTVEFANLSEDALDALVYCLALEEEVTVSLSPTALGPQHQQPVVLTGPLRHKVGGCKPHGGGSAHIQVTEATLRPSRADRYRAGRPGPKHLEGEALAEFIQRHSATNVKRNDTTMTELRDAYLRKQRSQGTKHRVSDVHVVQYSGQQQSAVKIHYIA